MDHEELVEFYHSLAKAVAIVRRPDHAIQAGFAYGLACAESSIRDVAKDLSKDDAALAGDIADGLHGSLHKAIEELNEIALESRAEREKPQRRVIELPLPPQGSGRLN